MNPRSLYTLALFGVCAAMLSGAPDIKGNASPAGQPGSEIKIKDASAAPAAIKSEKDAAGHDTLSVDFPDEEIRTVLRNVADLFELNLVIPETLHGKTSIKLRDVTWRQIFRVVLGPAGYTFVEEGNIIKVVSNESLQQEPVGTEVFVLNYARASDIQAAVSSLVETAAGGKLVIDARSNALVISERPSRLLKIRPIIESLDHATDQVMIESKFIEVTDSDIRKLGVNWTSLQAYKVGVGPGNEDGSFGSYKRTNTQTTSNTVDSTYTQLAGLTGTTTTDKTLTAVFSADSFNVILSALNTLSSTKIVSNPTVVTLNNTEATINVGEEYPIPNYTYNQERGTFEVSGFNYRSIGIILKVTPQVNAQGFIKLNLEPEVSQRNGETTFGGASGASIPIIASRKAKTQVSLKDGFTMGIGGLLRKQATDSSTKVPVLGDIPLLGRLFRSKSKDAATTNLLIFITAKVLSAQGGTTQQVFDPRQIKDAGLHEHDLPGYREEKSALLPESEAEAGKETEKK